MGRERGNTGLTMIGSVNKVNKCGQSWLGGVVEVRLFLSPRHLPLFTESCAGRGSQMKEPTLRLRLQVHAEVPYILPS